MGIPKFARLLCERYPCLCQLACDVEVPEFDNLYLDMNGIIHNCTHDNNAEVSLMRPESEVIKNIFAYIEMLFRVVRPKKLFFMAVDGVAPRAKINQQRARRFMSAKNAEMALAKFNRLGTVVDASDRFDSNCITPGTAFMDRLHGYLKYFVYMKMNTDPLWKGVTVIYSGHDYAGEGEHKIMSYIRYIRAKKSYSPATRHCLYGLDADLIILGLVCHEPYFSLLREEVTYRPKRKSPTRPVDQKPTRFYLLHLSLLREYISMDFSKLQEDYPTLFNLESLIDDWVLMVCLLGNDFLPHLADLHTHQNVLPNLCAAYMSVFGKMQGYVNEAGRLNLRRLGILFEKLSEMDRANFTLIYEDFVYARGSDEISVIIDNSLVANRREFWSGKTLEDDGNISESYASEWDDEMEEADLLVNLKLSYIKGLQWNLYYYYEGVASWEWFYPYHYSPFITDLKGFENVNLRFVKGTSLPPFCQQMAVLPPASRQLVPEAFQDLMVDPSSPLISFYPEDFEIDLNGKRNDWESVVKLPFIDLELLNSVVASRENLLTAEEKRRSKPGCSFLYTYDRNMQGQDVVSSDPDLLPTVKNCKVRCQALPIGIFDIDPKEVVHGLLLNEETRCSTFPTFNQLLFERSIRCIHQRAYSPVSIDSVVLSVRPNGFKSLEDVAAHLLGTWVMVKWPHCVPALCTTVSTITDRYTCGTTGKKRKLEHQCHDEQMQQEWAKLAMIAEDELYSNTGIEVHGSEIMVHCSLPDGMRYLCDSNGQPKVMFSWKQPVQICPYPVILPCTDARQYFLRGKDDLKSLYPIGAVVFSMATSTYGLSGNIVARSRGAMLRVRIRLLSSLPSGKDLLQKLVTKWFSADQLAKDLKMSRLVISRLTGTVPLYKGAGNERESEWENIGFNLKLTKMSMEMPGYATKDVDGFWVYSSKVRDHLMEYKQKFPEVIAVLTEIDKAEDKVYAVDIWTNDELGKRMAELTSWLGKLPFQSLKWQPCGAPFVKTDFLSTIEQTVDKLKATKRYNKASSFVANLKIDDVYCCTSVLGKWELETHTDHRLLDRVVFIQAGFSVPVGLAGTIVQLPPMGEMVTTDVLVLFDEEFVGGFRLDGCEKRSAYYVPLRALLNMSHGERVNRRLPSSSSSLAKQVSSPENTSRESIVDRSAKKEILGRLPSRSPQACPNEIIVNENLDRKPSLGHMTAVDNSALNEAALGLTSLRFTDRHSVESASPALNAPFIQSESTSGLHSTSNGFSSEVTSQPAPLPGLNNMFLPQEYEYFPLMSGNPQFQGNVYPQAPFPFGAQPSYAWQFGHPGVQVAGPLPPMMYPMQFSESERIDVLPVQPQGIGYPLPAFQRIRRRCYFPLSDFVHAINKILDFVQMNQQGILAECSDDETYNPGRVSNSTVWVPDKERAVSLLETIKHYGYDGLPKLERPLPTNSARPQPSSYGCALGKGEARTQEAEFPGCSHTSDFWKQ
ncbi:intein splicing region [Trichuris suis]|nr:intein splicing region [Trichuris suis]